MCLNCNDANQLYDQATKKCINCSVPGLASMNTSGWTSTTYPVETCTPCDATKNEYAMGTGGLLGFEEGRTCTTCEGTIGLSENNNRLGTKDVVCIACPTNAPFNTVTKVCDCIGILSDDKKTCTACAANEYISTVDKACKDCIGTVSDDKKTCTACDAGQYFNTVDKACKDCIGTLSADKKTCTACDEFKYFSTVDKACKDCIGYVSDDFKTCTPC